MPVGKPLHLRLFLEGREVPVVSAQVSINTSAPATASIQIIPLDTALDLLPRTMVHLFFLDTKVDQGTGAVGQQLGGGRLRGTYRLLFSGEVVGFAYSQTPASRGLILQCLDFSNYWDSAHVMAISYGPGGNAFTNQGSVNGAQTGLFTDIPGDSAAEHLVRWIRARPVTPALKGISGLAGGIIHIMEAIGGVPGHFKGVNDFYTIAELRCRLLNQVTAEEDDTTASRVLSINVFHEWLKNGIEQAGGNITFRDVMKLLFRYIYYEFVPNPAPKFDEGQPPPTTTTHKVPLNQLSSVARARAEIRQVWSDTLIQPGTSPSSAAVDSMMNAAIAKLKSVIKSLEKIGNTTSKAVQILKDVQTKFGKIRLLDATDSVSSDNITRSSKLDINRIKLLDAINLLGGNEPVSVTNPPGGSASQRLRTQIVRPDCWFSSPPACNVIFPEMYAQLSYDRNFLQETTRLLIATFDRLVGKDRLLANYTLAPRDGFDAEKLSKFKGSRSFRILMDHEIHVGIIHKHEWIPNTAGISQTLNSEQMKKVQDARLSWVIKASLFHFFKYRFAARQVSVAGRFNPFLVCGFPSAVITRPYIINGGAETLRQNHNGAPVPDSEINSIIHQKATELHAPSHFVGMIGAIQHSVDQSGGTTSAILHHARKHRGIDDEFLGILATTNEGKAKRVVKVIIDIDTAHKLAFPGGNALPNQKALSLLVGVTPQEVEAVTTTIPAARPTRLYTESSTKASKKVSVDPRAQLKSDIKDALSVLDAAPTEPTTDERFDAEFGSTQITEQDSSLSQSTSAKDPERTARGPIPEVNRENVLVPKGATKVKINEKKGLYGGRIVGIEVLDSNTFPVTYLSSAKTLQFVKVSDDATAEQFQGMPGFEDVRRSTTIRKFPRTSTSSQLGVAFSKVAIYEEIEVPVSGSLPIEEVLRPSWFSTSYANVNIGKKIYEPFFGCGAVVDGLLVGGETPQSADASPDAEPVDASVSAKDLTIRLSAEESATRANSLEKALNLLGYEYGQVKTQGLDVDSFIRDYTDRPIATYQDIFGDPDLKFSIVDSAVGGDVKVLPTIVNGAPVTPRVGFHTAATHPDLSKIGKLVGLTTDLQLGYKRINGIGKDEPLVTRYDVRPAKQAKVTLYLEELGRGPGFIG